MLKACSVIFLLLCVVFCFGTVYGEPITVAWDGPVVVDNWKDVTGFELRVNDNLVDISGNVRQWSGDVALIEGTNMADLRAVTATEQSDWSEPCYFNRSIPFKLFSPTGCTVINIEVN